MTVPFSEAIANLQAMFPNVEEPVIKCILDAHNNHLEHTIEALLQMQADDENKSAPPPKPSSTIHSQVGASLPNSINPASAGTIPSDGGTHSKNVVVVRGHRLDLVALPDDFLRIPPKVQSQKTPEDEARQRQMLQDQLIAEALQNELFMKELQQRHPEFRDIFEAPRQQAQQTSFSSGTSGQYNAHGIPDYARTTRESRNGSSTNDASRDERNRSGSGGVSLGSRLSAMSGALKNRFNMLALQFKQRSSKGKRMSTGGEGYSLLQQSSSGDGQQPLLLGAGSEDQEELESVELSNTRKKSSHPIIGEEMDMNMRRLSGGDATTRGLSLRNTSGAHSNSNDGDFSAFMQRENSDTGLLGNGNANQNGDTWRMGSTLGESSSGAAMIDLDNDDSEEMPLQVMASPNRD